MHTNAHTCLIQPQEWKPGTLVWLRNSARDTRKKKFLPRWLGPYKIIKCLDKNVYRIARLSTGLILKKAVNGCRLKAYHKPIEKPSSYPKPRLCDSFLFQYGTPEASRCISSDAGLGDDDTIPPLPPPMPPLNELIRKPKAVIPALNAFEGFTTSTPVLKGGFFPEFFPGTALNLPPTSYHQPSPPSPGN